MSKQTILHVENLKVSFDVSSEGDMPWTKPKKLKAVNDKIGRASCRERV